MEEENLLHKSNEKGKKMDPTTAMAAANAIGNIAGSFGGGNSSKKALKAWTKQFNMQKEWEKEKMQSSHQWEVQDLLNAGLNPVLSANGGAMNASAPNPTLPDYSTYENAKTQKLATAINLMNAYTQAKAQSSQAELNEATKLKTEQEAGMIEPKAMAEIRHLNSAAAVNKAQKNLVESETENTKTDTEKKKTEKKDIKQRIIKQEMGLLGNIFGTNPEKHKGKWAQFGAGVIAGMIPYGKAIKLGKKIRSAKQFGNFLNTVK